METQELIKALAADNQRSGMPITLVWTGAAVIAIALAACVFFVLLGPRPDITSAMQTLRFPFKIVVAIALAVSSSVHCVRCRGRKPSHATCCPL